MRRLDSPLQKVQQTIQGCAIWISGGWNVLLLILLGLLLSGRACCASIALKDISRSSDAGFDLGLVCAIPLTHHAHALGRARSLHTQKHTDTYTRTHVHTYSHTGTQAHLGT